MDSERAAAHSSPHQACCLERHARALHMTCHPPPAAAASTTHSPLAAWRRGRRRGSGGRPQSARGLCSPDRPAGRAGGRGAGLGAGHLHGRRSRRAAAERRRSGRAAAASLTSRASITLPVVNSSVSRAAAIRTSLTEALPSSEPAEGEEDEGRARGSGQREIPAP